MDFTIGFKRAMVFVLVWEGGDRFTDDPSDPGGATKFGISLNFLRSVNPSATVDMIRNLNHDTALLLYHEHFWRRLRLDSFPASVAMVMMDTAVNLGVGRAARYLQAFLAVGNRSVSVDGAVGPRTVSAWKVAHAAWISEWAMCIWIMAHREAHYRRLATKTDWAGRYLNGWLNRLNDLGKETVALVTDASVQGGK